jgi:signal transduction histidine kinase
VDGATLLVVLAPLLPLLLLGVAALVAWRSIWADTATVIEQAAATVAEFGQRELTLQAVAAGRMDALLRGLSDEQIRANEPALHRALKALVDEIPGAESGAVLDRHGAVLVSADVFPVARDGALLAGSDFFQALAAADAPALHVSRLHPRRHDDKLSFSVSRRRTGSGNADLPPGGFDGLVNLSVAPDTLAAQMRRIRPSNTEAAALIREDGEILARTTGLARPGRAAPEVVAALAGRPDRAVLTNRSALDGSEFLVALRRIEGWPVYAAAGRPRAAVVAAWRQEVAEHLVVGLPATLALLLGALAVRRGQRRLAAARDGLEKRVAERTAALAEKETRLRAAAEGAGLGNYEIDFGAGRAWFDTRGAAVAGGVLPAERWITVGGPEWQALEAAIHPEDRDAYEAAWQRVVMGEAEGWSVETRIRRLDGNWCWDWCHGVVLEREAGSGRPLRLVGILQDVSEQRRLEAELRQAQKLQALGELAGGMAHDFNNVLQAVEGAARMIERAATDPDAVRRRAGTLHAAVERGAAITGRLLVFARRGEAGQGPVAVQPLLAELREILGATLGGGITVEFRAAPGLPPLRADRAQLQTVLLNLATNARDAMPQGGTLEFSAEAGERSAGSAGPPGLAPGAYLRLSVRDTGAGMNAATLARVTEPFFTTKPAGQGTGLGLSMARQFAEKSGGRLEIASAPGHGTTVTLWLPQYAALAGAA